MMSFQRGRLISRNSLLGIEISNHIVFGKHFAVNCGTSKLVLPAEKGVSFPIPEFDVRTQGVDSRSSPKLLSANGASTTKQRRCEPTKRVPVKWVLNNFRTRFCMGRIKKKYVRVCQSLRKKKHPVTCPPLHFGLVSMHDGIGLV